MTDRLDPKKLHDDAAAILARSSDPVALVAQLLRHLRQNDDVQNAIKDGYSYTSRWFREELNRTEARTYMACAHIVRRAKPSPTTELSYGGAQRQIERQLRQAARWSEVEL